MNLASAPVPSIADRVAGVLHGTAAASALARAASPGGPGAGRGVESTLQLFVVDGLLDALEWAASGVGADDTACLWLGALRWVKAVDGAVPAGAPEPPTRPLTAAFGSLADACGGDPQNLVGLRSPEMSQPRRPFNRPADTVPELAATDGAGVLARAAALGLLAHAQEDDVRRLATAAAALSHGSPDAHAAAADAAAVLHASARGVWAVRGALAAVLGQEYSDSPSRAALRRALESVGTILSDLDGAEQLHPERAWGAVQALADNGDEGAAAYAGALVGALTGPSFIPAAAGCEDALIDAISERLAAALSA